MIRRIFILLILVAGASKSTKAWSQSCGHAFSRKIERAGFKWYGLAFSNPQEAIWDAQERGYRELASRLIERTVKELESINDLRRIPRNSQIISNAENKNTVYKVQLDGFYAAVKLSDRAAIVQPLVYQIANILGVPIPITIPVQIGGDRGIAQIFMEDWIRLVDAIPQNGAITIDPLFEFFDHLITNTDRSLPPGINMGNILVR